MNGKRRYLKTKLHDKEQGSTQWIDVCGETDLVLNSGVCAILPQLDPSKQTQVAIFSLMDINKQAE